jgi:hypothetical protein
MNKKLSTKFLIWIDARKKYHLSHSQIQMARELGLNPKGFGKIANHKQEPWKVPLGEYIENIYLKRFKKRSPDTVRSLAELEEDKKKNQETGKD